ncbi:hypothetical protein T459_15780 [Capsicum annuum]|uniref:Disease resistance protein winged helix domain-containing protein n=1 Tax=Capsicum annuum TaxID=4072 RepID=A0A2G2Z6U9_CAPAN|nr:hypothetical protein T459_15780 [Capsicum annuum]
MKVIELSYDHLPDHMKPCFLYLASFPKDTTVHRVMLKMYWRAEGLVEQTGMKSLEEVMEIYLDNLISSSLVIDFNEIGDNLTCQLHDLVHNFCLIKAREEKLFGQIGSSDASSSSDLMQRIVTINYEKEHFRPNNFVVLDSKMKRRSDEPILIAEHSKLENLRDLRILVLSYLKETEDIFIRFPNLQSLVFDLKESWDYSKERYWFPKLDHLTELDYLRADFESSNTNDSGPSLATNWSWDFHFPSNLKMLSLWDFPLTSDSLSRIARLSNLEELFLVRIITQEEEWNMGEEDTFVNLKYLELYEVTLAKWETGEKSFPVLEKLKMWECRKLEEIPPNFCDICSLKIIILVESPQLEDSAKKINQYVEGMGGDELQVLGRSNIPFFM